MHPQGYESAFPIAGNDPEGTCPSPEFSYGSKGFLPPPLAPGLRAVRVNHTLEYAIEHANALKKPVITCFALTPDYPEANERHYTFLLEGLADAGWALRERGIPLVVKKGAPPAVIADLAGDACLVVTDRGYLRHQREWRAEVAASVGCPVVMRPMVEAGQGRARRDSVA